MAPLFCPWVVPRVVPGLSKSVDDPAARSQIRMIAETFWNCARLSGPLRRATGRPKDEP